MYNYSKDCLNQILKKYFKFLAISVHLYCKSASIKGGELDKALAHNTTELRLGTLCFTHVFLGSSLMTTFTTVTDI